MFSQACVILSTGGGGGRETPSWTETHLSSGQRTPLCIETSLWAATLSEQTYLWTNPNWKGTPWTETPLSSDPICRETPSPLDRDPMVKNPLPLDRDPSIWTETHHQTETPWTETPPLNRAPPRRQ